MVASGDVGDVQEPGMLVKFLEECNGLIQGYKIFVKFPVRDRGYVFLTGKTHLDDQIISDRLLDALQAHYWEARTVLHTAAILISALVITPGNPL